MINLILYNILFNRLINYYNIIYYKHEIYIKSFFKNNTVVRSGAWKWDLPTVIPSISMGSMINIILFPVLGF